MWKWVKYVLWGRPPSEHSRETSLPPNPAVRVREGHLKEIESIDTEMASLRRRIDLLLLEGQNQRRDWGQNEPRPPVE